MSTMATRSYTTVPLTPAATTASVVIGDGQFGLPLARQMSSVSSALPLAHAPGFASDDIVVHGLELVRHEMVQQFSSYQTEDFEEHDIVLPAHHKVITTSYKKSTSLLSTRTISTNSSISSYNMTKSTHWTTPPASNENRQSKSSMFVNKMYSKFGTVSHFEGFTMVRSDAPESVRKQIMLVNEVAYILEKTHPSALEYDDEYDDDTASMCSDVGESDQDAFDDVYFPSDDKATEDIQPLDSFSDLTLASDLYELDEEETVCKADLAEESLATAATLGSVYYEDTKDGLGAAISAHYLTQTASTSSTESVGPVTPKMRTVGLVLVDGEDAYVVQQDELIGAEVLTLVAV